MKSATVCLCFLVVLGSCVRDDRDVQDPDDSSPFGDEKATVKEHAKELVPRAQEGSKNTDKKTPLSEITTHTNSLPEPSALMSLHRRASEEQMDSGELDKTVQKKGVVTPAVITLGWVDPLDLTANFEKAWSKIPVTDSNEFKIAGSALSMINTLMKTSRTSNLQVSCTGSFAKDIHGDKNNQPVWFVVRQMSESFKDKYLKQVGGGLIGVGGIASALANMPELFNGLSGGSEFVKQMLALANNPGSLSADEMVDKFFSTFDNNKINRENAGVGVSEYWKWLNGKQNDAFLTYNNAERAGYDSAAQFVCKDQPNDAYGNKVARVVWADGTVVTAKHLAFFISLYS